ncbi:MAG: hypothetical protein IJ612_07535 [Prevotella sp.]|nr:hypothetical protein [Prevotella sp.]
MTQLVITLKDQSYLPNIRRIVKSLQGVESVRASRQPRTAQKKRAVSPRRSSTHVLKGQTTGQISDPLEALESLGQLVRGTGKTSEQLIDEYLADKYGL